MRTSRGWHTHRDRERASALTPVPGETSQTERGGRTRMAHTRERRGGFRVTESDDNPRRPRGACAAGWGNARKRAVCTLTHWVSEYDAGAVEARCIASPVDTWKRGTHTRGHADSVVAREGLLLY